MFYVRVATGEGRAARQLRQVLVDVTRAQVGDTVIKQPNGRWAPSSANGGAPGDTAMAVADLRNRVAALEQQLALARDRVADLEGDRVVVEVGSESQGWTRVHGMRVDVESGDVLIGEGE